MSLGRPRIAIVDYGMGNRRSVEKAIERAGAVAVLTAEHRELRAADALVLPGVGAFPRAMESLNRKGLDRLLRECAAAGTQLLGICLGMQLLFERSDELGEPSTPGLGLIPGEVRRLAAGGLRLPHIGWNDVRLERESPLTARLPSGGAPFYHVHSYVAHPASAEYVIATCEYGERFATIVGQANVHGTQFHPEKSSRIGLELLSSFVELVRDTARDGAYA
jgi:glutamine amidotransferase